MPTGTWSGFGFSKSMPESALKDLVSNPVYFIEYCFLSFMLNVKRRARIFAKSLNCL